MTSLSAEIEAAVLDARHRAFVLNNVWNQWGDPYAASDAWRFASLADLLERVAKGGA